MANNQKGSKQVSTERVKKYRDTMKRKAQEYERLKAKDAERKRRERAIPKTEEEIKIHREKEKIRKAIYRSKQKSAQQSISNSGTEGYHTASRGKAVRRVKEALPKSPSKQASVLETLTTSLSPRRRHSLAVKLVPSMKRRVFIPRSTRTDQHLLNMVKRFYNTDLISRQLPGWKDFKSVKTRTGRIKVQKRTMVLFLKEAYSEFKRENPQLKIGFSTFAKCRPENVQLITDRDRNVCMCRYHEDIQMALDALLPFNDDIPTNAEDVLKLTVCSIDNINCMDRKCNTCSVDQLKDKIDIDNESRVSYREWDTEANVFTKVSVQCENVHELYIYFAGLMEKFSGHCFVARQQLRCLSNLKAELKEGSVIIQEDFSENYACKHQDEIMSAHWKIKQVTVFTAIAWYRPKEKGETKYRSYVVVSDSLDHNKYAVHTFNKLIVDDLRQITDIKHIHYWTDGAASQFKSKFMMDSLLHHEVDFNSTADWSFFATSHGKGPVDGIGGTVERSVYLEVLKGKAVVGNYTEFLSVAREKNSTITVLDCPKDNIAESERNLSDRFKLSPDLPGIRDKHFVQVTEHKLKMERISSFRSFAADSMDTEPAACSSMMETPTTPESSSLTHIGELIAVAYDLDVWYGEVIGEIGDGAFEVKFMVATGGKLKWPPKESKEIVHANHILPSRPQIAPCDGNLRAFKVTNLKDVMHDYNQLKLKW